MRRTTDDVDGTACQEWAGPRKRGSYGVTRLGGRPIGAHRLAWIQAFGPIPDGLHVCHRCDNPICVRPSHLFLGTRSDNMRDCAAKGRNGSQLHPERRPRGERAPGAKLTEERVREIRRRLAAGEPKRAIARAFGIDARSVTDIQTRNTWAHLEVSDE